MCCDLNPGEDDFCVYLEEELSTFGVYKFLTYELTVVILILLYC